MMNSNDYILIYTANDFPSVLTHEYAVFLISIFNREHVFIGHLLDWWKTNNRFEKDVQNAVVS